MFIKASLAVLLLGGGAPLLAHEQRAAAPPAQPTRPSQEAPHDRGHDVHTPKHEAVDAQEKPVTEALNSGVQANLDAQWLETARQTAQYQEDRAVYRSSVTAAKRKEALDVARYERQQAAYADAMAAWRYQTDECKRGVRKMCELPTPNPADFY